MELMTQVEYARHRGVSKQAINKALKAGKFALREENGRKGIDPAEADQALGLNVQRVLAGEDEDDLREAPARSVSSGLTAARTASEVYRARLAELEYNKQIGKLRPLEQTEAAAMRCFEVVLRAMLGIVGRAEEIHARGLKEGVAGTRASLRDALRDVRKVAAREFGKLRDGEAVDESMPLDFEGVE